MRPSRFGMTWCLVIAAAAFDSIYAWQHRAGMEGWELNRLARWAVHALGLAPLILFKMGGLILAVGMALYCYRRHHKLERRLTNISGLVYCSLLLFYVVGYLRPERRMLPPGMEAVTAAEEQSDDFERRASSVLANLSTSTVSDVRAKSGFRQ